MVTFNRWLTHLFNPSWRWRRAFSSASLKAIEQAVAASERQHSGQLRFVIENDLPATRVWQGLTARQRATELFAQLHVWDTEENCGVLIYLQLADKEVHILADRGISKRVNQAEWDAVAKAMENHFRQRSFQQGSLAGIEKITAILATHFPAQNQAVNELSDKPIILAD